MFKKIKQFITDLFRPAFCYTPIYTLMESMIADMRAGMTEEECDLVRDILTEVAKEDK